MIVSGVPLLGVVPELVPGVSCSRDDAVDFVSACIGRLVTSPYGRRIKEIWLERLYMYLHLEFPDAL